MGEGLVDNNPTIGTNQPDRGVCARERVLNNDELVAIWKAARVMIAAASSGCCFCSEPGGKRPAGYCPKLIWTAAV
jgi:hypothetical protein